MLTEHGGKCRRGLRRRTDSSSTQWRRRGSSAVQAARSRRPAWQNVRFFANPDAAMAAGYRACRRCHPAGEHAEAETVRRLCDYLDLACRPRGNAAGAWPAKRDEPIHRAANVRAGTGGKPAALPDRSALRASPRDILADGSSVTDAIYEAGFSPSSRMYEGADARLGMRPERFRKGGLGEQIRFLVTDCPLGKMLVAATARGLCAVTLGDDAPAMERELRERFTAADIRAATIDDEQLGATARAVIFTHDGASCGAGPAARSACDSV